MMLASCTQKASIVGQVERRSSKQILLYAYKQGELIEVGQQQLSEDGGFHFEFTPQEKGFYLIGDHQKALYPLYVQGGEELKVTLQRNRLVVNDAQDEANRLLYEWEDQVVPVREYAYLQAFIPEGKSVPYEEFFQELDRLAAAQQQYAQELAACGNPQLEQLFRFKSEAELNFYALSYLRSRGMTIPDSVEWCRYYKQMQPDRLFQDVKLLEVPFAGEMLDAYVWYLHKNTPLKEGESYDYKCLKEQVLQQEYLLNAVKRFKFHDEYQVLADELRTQKLTPEFEQRLKNAEKALLWSAPGVEAPAFEGRGVDSSLVKLSDFKGKLLVVDVWATWCSPCRMMMPYFMELERELADRDVAFLSVCIGVSIERDLWLELIRKDGLIGHHCFIASWTGDFATRYKITGVPRYMLIDREGKIITLNAPKPNKPELKEMILKALEEQQ